MKYFILALLLAAKALTAQFAPAAGKTGSTAIHADSSCFVAWATSCNLQLGYKQINQPDSGFVTVGTDLSAVGPAKQNGVVSLGDGGCAILEFNQPILNGDGFDFAVFENAFYDSFLELAHVEVSNDKINWIRFPSVSLTQTNKQTESFGFTYPEKIHNLAGKYRMPFGTPFDLEDLIDSPGYSSTFQYIRICDVVGSISSGLGTKDSKGNLINDPWPTLFPSSGFDLDAVGVIHQLPMSNVFYPSKQNVYFNSQTRTLHFFIKIESAVQVYSSNGALVYSSNPVDSKLVLPHNLSNGIYFIVGSGVKCKIVIQ